MLLTFSAVAITFVIRDQLPSGKVPLLFYTLLLGPALYLYLRDFLSPNSQSKNVWFYFSIFGIITLYSVGNYWLISDESSYRDWVLNSLPYLEGLTLVHLIIYYSFAFKLARGQWVKLGSRKFEWARKWIKFLLVAFLLLILSIVIYNLVEWTTFEYHLLPRGYYPQLIMISAFLYALTIWRLAVPEIVNISSGKSRSSPKRLESGESHIAVLNNLRKLMEIEKMFLRQDLTLDQLATRLEFPAKKLSGLFHDELDSTFNNYVNSFRIEEVKVKLSDKSNNHFKILAIAFDSEFNSKSTFNAAFKKVVGESPVEYRNRFNV